MLDPQLFRQSLEHTVQALSTRGYEFDASQFEALESRRKSIQQFVEDLQSQRNQGAKAIGLAKRNGDDTSEIMQQMASVNEQLKVKEVELETIQSELHNLLSYVPNLLDDAVPVGQDEIDNIEISRVGEPQSFDFTPLDHVAIGEALNGMSAAAGAKLTASRFTVLQGDVAHLHRALAQFMLNLHIQEHGYLETNVPTIVNRDSLYGTGQLPKFENVFSLADHNWCLSPTSEVSLTNLVRDTIIDEADLPLRYTTQSLCYRSEAGSYGKDTRGFIRQHQFEKVELVQIVKPEDSVAAHEELVQHAEKVLQLLELPYRKVLLCSGDTGFSARKTYDLEVWLPGQAAYREISSCSNTGDFQARRMAARFRRKGVKKPEFVHTLNGSGLAVGRTLVAVLENYQQADGRVAVPKVLQALMSKSVLEPVKRVL